MSTSKRVKSKATKVKAKQSSIKRSKSSTVNPSLKEKKEKYNLETARQIFVQSNISLNRLCEFTSVNKTVLQKVAHMENWTLQRTLYNTDNKEILQTLAQSQLTLLVIELNTVHVYAQRLQRAMRDKHSTIEMVKLLMTDFTNAISRARYLNHQVSAIPIVTLNMRMSSNSGDNGYKRNEIAHNSSTVQRWLRIPPSLTKALRAIQQTSKELSSYGLASMVELESLGTLHKEPKASENVEAKERKSNRYYKPLRHD